MSPPPDPAGALATVRARIARACARSGRPPQEVRLVAVTKTVPVEVIRLALEAGLEDFAENHAADLAAKASQISATWHFVGKLQTGTAPRVADHAALIHSAEPGRALERVAARADRAGRLITCLAQVDFTGRRQGVAPEELHEFLADAERLAGIQMAGLMTLPPWSEDSESTRPWFRRLRALRDELRPQHPSLSELSMGMSADYEIAVEEGATMVRLGTALFGPRPPARGREIVAR